MRALLDNNKLIRIAEPSPYLGKLRSQQLPEQWPDAYVGEVVAVPANDATARGIISVLRMIERLLHEPGK